MFCGMSQNTAVVETELRAKFEHDPLLWLQLRVGCWPLSHFPKLPKVPISEFAQEQCFFSDNFGHFFERPKIGEILYNLVFSKYKFHKVCFQFKGEILFDLCCMKIDYCGRC